MEKIDYKQIQFKAGLEIHQQLDSRKLFCHCPSILRKDEPNFKMSRKLHAVTGESGEIDVAARYQSSLDKKFIYESYDTTCLVEMDEEPPHEINQEALKIALQIALLMNMKILPITQIMRKTVIDGSNTSGFQRTVMVAYDGFIETSEGRVGIDFLFLEEDSARIISHGEDVETYRLDRLGIPLVEIVTSPDIKSAEHAKEVALKIGDILRSCKVRRGIGTIRQDVNVSIRGENRVEIKGMQDMDIFVKVIENEIKRQIELSDAKKPVLMEVRNALKDYSTQFMRPLPGKSRMYPETDLPLLRISRDFINEIKKSLPKLRNEIENDLKKMGLSQEMIQMLFKQNKLEEFKELLEVVDNPILVGKILLIFLKDLAKREKKTLKEVENILTNDVLGYVLENFNKKKISEAQIKSVLERIIHGENIEDAIKFKEENLEYIEENIFKIIKEKPNLSEKAYMGLVMKSFGSQINGKNAMEIIKKYIG